MERSDPLLPPDTAPASPGGQRLGSIELQRVLANSGHAVVHQAWDHALGRPVVVEEYFPPALARRDADGRVQPLGPETAERFEQGRAWFVDAWRTLGQCDHPSLLRVLLLLEAHGTAYAVTPAQTGELLADQSASFPLDEVSLRGLLDDLLGALAAYHRTGRQHGDIGPSTVRWQPGGPALLVSPGAAQPAGGTAEHRGGTPAAAADLHALALLARFCITGTMPAPLVPGAPEPLPAAIERLGFEGLAARYGPDLAALLQRATSPDPAQWPDSVAQFRAGMGAPAPASTRRDTAGPQPATAPPRRPPAAAPQRPPRPAAPMADEPAFDPSTSEHIQRVLHSFAEPGDRARRPRRPPPVGDAAAFAHTAAYALPPEPRRWPLWLGLAVVATVFGLGAWQIDRRPPDGVRIVGAAPAPLPAASSPTEPALPAAAPLPAPPTPPPPPAVEPETAPPSGAGPVASPEPAQPVAVPAPAPPPAKPPPARRPRAAAAPTTPRATCGPRTQFSLYRCMQQVCSTARWRAHPECARLRATDSVD